LRSPMTCLLSHCRWTDYAAPTSLNLDGGGMTRANLHRIGKILFGIVGFALSGCQSPMRTEAALAGAGTPSPGSISTGSVPRFSADGPDADEYGARLDYPVKAVNRPRFWVGIFSHQDQLLEGRLIRRADTPSRLARASVEPALSYMYDGQKRTIDDYLARNPTTGLLIARGDTILVERYQYGRNDRHRFTSASMAKTVTAMLIGIAISEGRIRSVDDPAAAYVPALADTEYGRTSLRHLLQMSSGVRFEENYAGGSDIQRLWLETVLQESAGGAAAVRPFNQRHRLSGALFSYSSAETQVLGLVLSNAVGSTVAEYLRQKLWEPMGAEGDATWIIDAAGQEATYCCLNAVLRDYARLALLLAHDGRLGDKQIIPSEWMREATTVPADRPDLSVVWPEAQLGYGYQTWIINGERRMFALIGVQGQAIYVDPTNGLVLVHTAVRRQAADPNKETLALFRGIVDAVGGPHK
jgi:CubicO group peptidase (beta-lactamase class C family)